MKDGGIEMRFPNDRKKSKAFILGCMVFLLSIIIFASTFICLFIPLPNSNPYIGILICMICVFGGIWSYNYVKSILAEWSDIMKKVVEDKKEARRIQDEEECTKYILSLDAQNSDETVTTDIDTDDDKNKTESLSPLEKFQKEVSNAVKALVATLDRYTDISEEIGHINVCDNNVIDAIYDIVSKIEEGITANMSLSLPEKASEDSPDILPLDVPDDIDEKNDIEKCYEEFIKAFGIDKTRLSFCKDKGFIINDASMNPQEVKELKAFLEPYEFNDGEIFDKATGEKVTIWDMVKKADSNSHTEVIDTDKVREGTEKALKEVPDAKDENGKPKNSKKKKRGGKR